LRERNYVEISIRLTEKKKSIIGLKLESYGYNMRIRMPHSFISKLMPNTKENNFKEKNLESSERLMEFEPIKMETHNLLKGLYIEEEAPYPKLVKIMLQGIPCLVSNDNQSLGNWISEEE
jgi:hypothetical protein